ncbi:hypothetical protein GGR53DRAFT_314266 [Hypoxylon sp. FL1150]|nr:hypothetical protein GGR53DRAFT_314266 [Hypoxylon sp. FL1150]
MFSERERLKCFLYLLGMIPIITTASSVIKLHSFHLIMVGTGWAHLIAFTSRAGPEDVRGRIFLFLFFFFFFFFPKFKIKRYTQQCTRSSPGKKTRTGQFGFPMFFFSYSLVSRHKAAFLEKDTPDQQAATTSGRLTSISTYSRTRFKKNFLFLFPQASVLMCYD